MCTKNVLTELKRLFYSDAAGQVQDAAVHQRGGRREEANGKQLPAPPASQRQESAFFQLMQPQEN